MRDDDRVDLSHLEMRPAEWNALYASTMTRVTARLAGRRRRMDPVLVVSEWRRQILLAAAVLLAMLIPVELALEIRERGRGRVRTLAEASGDAARGLRELSPTDLLKAVGRERLP